jgi:hypothetical protein
MASDESLGVGVTIRHKNSSKGLDKIETYLLTYFCSYSMVENII